MRRYSSTMRIERSTGQPNWMWPEREETNCWHFSMIPDETQSLSMMGDSIVCTHQGVLASLNPRTGAVTPISATRDTYAGIFGPGARAATRRQPYLRRTLTSRGARLICTILRSCRRHCGVLNRRHFRTAGRPAVSAKPDSGATATEP